MEPQIKLCLNTEQQNEPWLIALTLSHAHIVEDGDELVPGICLTPDKARILARKLIDLSFKADDRTPKEG